MNLQRRLRWTARDAIAGAIFVAAGAFFAFFARSYAFGSARLMGPGYFPTALGFVLIALGAVIILRSFIKAADDATITWAWKPLAINCAALIAFAVLVRGAGLVPAVFALALISASASAHFDWRTAAALAAALAAFSHAGFYWGLGLPLPPFGSWFGG